jgi:hypothetical protein
VLRCRYGKDEAMITLDAWTRNASWYRPAFTARDCAPPTIRPSQPWKYRTVDVEDDDPARATRSALGDWHGGGSCRLCLERLETGATARLSVFLSGRLFRRVKVCHQCVAALSEALEG